MLVVGFAGGTGSGKTGIVREITENLSGYSIAVLPQDSYYKDSASIPPEERSKINFDHPDSIEFDLLIQHLIDLENGKKIEQPIYTYQTALRSQETITVEPADVIILEGILLFTNSVLRELMNVKVFVDVDADDRLLRLIKRDTVKRSRTVEEVTKRYEEVLKPMHTQFIEPSKQYADIIIPRGKRNKVAIDMLTRYLESYLIK